MPDLAHSQRTALRIITRWGGVGYLLRGGSARECICARSDYTPQQRGLFLDGSERFFIAALGLAVPPDFELDMLRFKEFEYRILLPPAGPRPNGLVMFYDCNVMRL